MARPTTTRLTPAPDFAARQQGATEKLGVYAPLDVKVGPSGAEQLANALGMAVEVASPILKKEVYERAEEQTRAGMNDAMVGTINEVLDAEDEFYARGHKSTLTKRATLDAMRAWEQRYEKGEVDKTSVESVRDDLNLFMKEKVGGFLADPETAKWAGELLAPFEQQTLGALHKEQVAQFKVDTVATALDTVREKIRLGQPVNAEEIKNLMVSGGLSRSAATAEYVKGIGTFAIEAREPALLDMLIPEQWADGTPGPRSIPALNEEINQARYYAEAARKAADAAAKAEAMKAADTAVGQATLMAVRGDERGVRAALEPLVEQGLVERAEFFAIVNAARSSLEYGREQSISPAGLADFRYRLSAGEITSKQQAYTEALSLVPGGGPAAQRAVQTLSDDIDSNFRARENDNNPIAKAYRNNLDARLKPDTTASAAKKERYAAVMLTYDTTLAKTNDPEKAREAAEKIAAGTAPAAKPTGPSRQIGSAVVTPISE